MNEIAVSVVIPIYNGGDRVEKCLRYLDRQTIKENYEVLLVDDASTDDSVRKIRATIETLDNSDRFQLIECRKNGRAGTARNIGIRHAKGTYILFVDQDDYPELTLLEKLYELAKNGSVDCVVSNVQDKNGKVYHRPPCKDEERISENTRKLFLTDCGYVFSMLIKRELIRKNHLFFPEAVMFEDSLYNVGLFACVGSLAKTEEALYIRETDENSQTANLSSKKLLDRIRATKWYLHNFEHNDQITKYRLEVYLIASYYIYLSCVWWMVIDKSLYTEELFHVCMAWARRNIKKDAKITWTEIERYQSKLPRYAIAAARLIYCLPSSYNFLSAVGPSMWNMKKKLKM